MEQPRKFIRPPLITNVTIVSPKKPSAEDYIIMDEICDLVAKDMNAIILMRGQGVLESGGWPAHTQEQLLHSRLLRFTLTAYGLGKGMSKEQDGCVWDLIQAKYDY